MKFAVGPTLIACPVCQNTTFDLDYRQLNSRGASFFGLDWANRNAAILVCKHCTHISWFMNEPQRVE